MFPMTGMMIGGSKEVIIELWGAGGESSGTPGYGKAGGYLKVTMFMPVTTELAIVVGEEGYRGTNSSYDGDGGGGNSFSSNSGGGGGISGVFYDSPMVIANAIAVAGGGGGGGYQSNAANNGGWLDIGSGLRPLYGGGGGINSGAGGSGYEGGLSEAGGSSWYHADAEDVTLTIAGGSSRSNDGKVIITINGIEEFNQTAHSEAYTLTV